MYWNSCPSFSSCPLFRLIETWDVLKRQQYLVLGYYWWWLIETWDVLKPWRPGGRTWRKKINRNMRCIETVKLYKRTDEKNWINRNMRCIETSSYLCRTCRKSLINRNMRCIETRLTLSICLTKLGLIETWDVLKRSPRLFLNSASMINRNMRCIETSYS